MKPVTDIMLERFLAGDLPSRKSAEIKDALGRDPVLAARLETLKLSTDSFLESASPEIFARRLAGRLEHEASVKSSWWAGLQAWSPALVLFCAVLGIFWTTFEESQSDDFDMLPSLDAVARVEPLLVQSNKAGPSLAETSKQESLEKVMVEAPVAAPPVGASAPKGVAKRLAKQARSAGKELARQQAPKSKKRRKRQPEPMPPSLPALAAMRAPPPVQPALQGATSAMDEVAPQVATRSAKKSVSRMMVAQAASGIKLLVRNPSGAARHLEDGASVARDEVIEADASWRGPLYWGHLISRPDQKEPLVSELKAKAWSRGSAITRPSEFSGEATVWLVGCHVDYSTEDILFDGITLRSKNKTCRVFSFLVLFLK